MMMLLNYTYSSRDLIYIIVLFALFTAFILVLVLKNKKYKLKFDFYDSKKIGKKIISNNKNKFLYTYILFTCKQNANWWSIINQKNRQIIQRIVLFHINESFTNFEVYKYNGDEIMVFLPYETKAILDEQINAFYQSFISDRYVIKNETKIALSVSILINENFSNFKNIINYLHFVAIHKIPKKQGIGIEYFKLQEYARHQRELLVSKCLREQLIHHEKEYLYTVFQPKYDIQNHRHIVGFEALA